MNEIKPLDFSDWVDKYNIEEKYQIFHDEYGDAACLLSEYKERRYREYLEFIQQLNLARSKYAEN